MSDSAFEKPLLVGSGSQNNTNSPLNLFLNVKTIIFKILLGLVLHVDDSKRYLSDAKEFDQNLIINDKYIQQLPENVNEMVSKISRDHMKVVFFGGGSSGKSTSINAMVRERIVPVGLGNTTICFLQIEGTNESEPSVFIPGSDEPKSFKCLNGISNALSKEKIDSDSLIKILLPKEQCRFLQNDVVLVDSPDIGISVNLDQWIEKHCLDADVFVLVISAVATITVTEKKFLHNVAQRVSNPDIFILMNRWDLSVDEPEMTESVKQQHLDRGLEFLCDELNLYDRKEASEHRIFFISARETFLSRNKDPCTSSRSGFNEGHEERLAEFCKFEHELEHCISKTAIKSKFGRYTKCGKEIIELLNKTIGDTMDKLKVIKQVYTDRLNEMKEKRIYLEHQLSLIIDSMKQKIQDITEDFHQRVAETLDDEIKRLYTLIENVDLPFSFHPDQTSHYKQDLQHWVENHLTVNLQKRLDTALYSSLVNLHLEIKDRVKPFLSNAEQQLLVNSLIPRSDIVVLYHMNFSNICSDFHGDIQSTSSSSVTRTESGLLALGTTGIMYRTFGWTMSFVYEKLWWKKNIEEHEFKCQYVDHVSSKKNLIIDFISNRASAQVQQELSKYFAQMIRDINMEIGDMNKDIKTIQNEIDQLESYIDKGQYIQKQGDEIDNQLNQFSKQYLLHD